MNTKTLIISVWIFSSHGFFNAAQPAKLGLPKDSFELDYLISTGLLQSDLQKILAALEVKQFSPLKGVFLSFKQYTAMHTLAENVYSIHALNPLYRYVKERYLY